MNDDLKENAICLTREDVCRVADHLTNHRLVHKTDPGVMGKSWDTSYDLDPSDMVSVAVKVKLDSTPINDLTKDEQIKVGNKFWRSFLFMVFMCRIMIFMCRNKIQQL